MPSVRKICDTSDARLHVSGNLNMEVLVFPSMIWLALASKLIESRHTVPVSHS